MKKPSGYILLAMLFLVSGAGRLSAQILYGITNTQNGVKIVKINLATCEVCPIQTITGLGAGNDLTLLPNGDLVVVGTYPDATLLVYDLPNPTPVFSNSGINFYSSVLSPGGLVYLSAGPPVNPGVHVFNPATGVITYLGPTPQYNGINTYFYDFFYNNGQLYATGGANGGSINLVYLVNTTTPAQSTLVYETLGYTPYGNLSNNGYIGFYNGGVNIGLYDLTSNTSSLVCDLSSYTPLIYGISGLTEIPPGVAELPCGCAVSAGTMAADVYNVCVNNVFTAPYLNNQVLGSGDLLQYILFSNPADTLGSVVALNNTPEFSFNPATMQPGVTYYAAAIAGQGLNGNVNLSDPCLDISNAAQLIWHPAPTVQLQSADNTACADSPCMSVTAQLSGTPVFDFTYDLLNNGVANGSSVSVSGVSSPYVFTVCPPEAGIWELRICQISDAWCTNE